MCIYLYTYTDTYPYIQFKRMGSFVSSTNEVSGTRRTSTSGYNVFFHNEMNFNEDDHIKYKKHLQNEGWDTFEDFVVAIRNKEIDLASMKDSNGKSIFKPGHLSKILRSILIEESGTDKELSLLPSSASTTIINSTSSTESVTPCLPARMPARAPVLLGLVRQRIPSALVAHEV